MMADPQQLLQSVASAPVAPLFLELGRPIIPPGTPDNLIELLRCPVTGGKLRWMKDVEIEKLNAACAEGTAIHLDRSRVSGEVVAALINEEGSLIYRVEDGILMMLPVGAIAADAEALSRYGAAHRAEKAAIQSFYDQIGWTRDEKGDFEDAVIWEDLRPVSARYLDKCHLRVNRYLKQGGDYLLDVASGPVQYAQYLTYSETYRWRICMDISIAALREARKKVGAKGVYILGDITRLPLASDSLDAVVSLHTIYHVPQDEQPTAFEELYRVLKPGRSGVVVYTFSNSPIQRAMQKPARWWKKARNSAPIRLLKRALGRSKPAPPRADPSSVMANKPFYFHAHPLNFFESRKWSFPLEIVAWRSINVQLLRTYIHPKRAGKLLLAMLYQFEEWFPRFAGRNGPYPMFILRK